MTRMTAVGAVQLKVTNDRGKRVGMHDTMETTTIQATTLQPSGTAHLHMADICCRMFCKGYRESRACQLLLTRIIWERCAEETLSSTGCLQKEKGPARVPVARQYINNKEANMRPYRTNKQNCKAECKPACTTSNYTPPSSDPSSANSRPAPHRSLHP